MIPDKYSMEFPDCDSEVLQMYVASADLNIVLLLPSSLVPTKDGRYVFPSRTLDILQEIRDDDDIKATGVHVNIGVSDDKFAQTSLRSDEGSLEWVVALVSGASKVITVIKAIFKVVRKRMKALGKNESDSQVKLDITIVDKGAQKRIKYSGPAMQSVESVLIEAVRNGSDQRR